MSIMVEVHTETSLSKFSLGFEHDITWAEIKRKTRARRKRVDTKRKK